MRTAVVELLGHLARRRKDRDPARPPATHRYPTAGDDTVEPLYGKTYLPRKFKTAFACPMTTAPTSMPTTWVFWASSQGGRLVGYNVLVGGGLGTTPSAQKTFPFLAVPLCYVDRGDVLAIGEAVLKVFRDFGNRSDRKRARLKYIIHDWGLPAFRAKVEEYLGHPLLDPKPVHVSGVDDHLGWHSQGDGKLFLGIPVENGRIKDEGDYRLASGLRAFFQKYQTPARLTCQQSILLADLDPAWQREIERWLRYLRNCHRRARSRPCGGGRWPARLCPPADSPSPKPSAPCPVSSISSKSSWHGSGSSKSVFTVRMTGCPNGCARPYNADIGLVGRSAHVNADGTPGPGTYTIFLGGRTVGDRLNIEFKDYVPYDQVVAELVPVFSRFKAERNDGESFGDFCDRIGIPELAGSPVDEVNAVS